MLLDMPEVVSLLDELRKEFDATDVSKLYPAYLDRFNSVTEWKFSSGDYYAPIPYESERMGFSPDVPIKKKYKSVDEARWLGKYCAGFVGGEHVVTVRPGQRTVNALLATLYDEVGPILGIRSVSFRGLGKPEMRSAIGGLGRIISRADNTRLHVGVGIGGAFAVSLYQYSNEGRPIRARAMSKGYPGEAAWEYHYTPEGQLDEITTGGPVPLWKRKK
jgi:hypothetical protein